MVSRYRKCQRWQCETLPCRPTFPILPSALDTANFQHLADIISIPVCIGVPWDGVARKGKFIPQYFFLPKNSFLLPTELTRDKKLGWESEEKGVCILRTSSNHYSPFLNRLLRKLSLLVVTDPQLPTKYLFKACALHDVHTGNTNVSEEQIFHLLEQLRN